MHLRATALTKVSLKMHQKMLKGKFQERIVELIWSQEPSITLQFWIWSALAPGIWTVLYIYIFFSTSFFGQSCETSWWRVCHQRGYRIYFQSNTKLDGVGPVDNRPSPAKLHHFVRKKHTQKTHDMWHLTCDIWHVTYYTRHVTCDMFGEVNIPSKFQLPSSYWLWFMIIWRSGGKGSLNELMNYEAVYRTAPATPGLLIT